MEVLDVNTFAATRAQHLQFAGWCQAEVERFLA
jgi:hypothetical protein